MAARFPVRPALSLFPGLENERGHEEEEHRSFWRGAPSLPRPQFAQRKVAQGGRGRRKGEPRLGHRRGVIGDHPFSLVRGPLLHTPRRGIEEEEEEEEEAGVEVRSRGRRAAVQQCKVSAYSSPSTLPLPIESCFF